MIKIEFTRKGFGLVVLENGRPKMGYYFSTPEKLHKKFIELNLRFKTNMFNFVYN